MQPGDESVSKLRDWLVQGLASEGISAANDPALMARIEVAARAAVARFRQDPGRDITIAVTGNAGGRAVERSIRLSPRQLGEIVSRPPTSGLADTRIAQPTMSVPPPPPYQPPAQPAYPPPPAYIPPPGGPPTTASSASSTSAPRWLWLVLAFVGAAAVVAVGVVAVVALTGGDDDDDGDDDGSTVPGTGDPTQVPATATATPTIPRPTPPPTATPTPRRPTVTPTPEMHPGRTVRVANTEPDPCLYLRPAPDRTTTPLTCLLQETEVRLLTGPDDRDGVRWWYVEVPSYNGRRWEGYAAERALDSDVAWLVPD